MAKRTICVATATRAEYGLLRWLMKEVQDDPDLTLQCVVTGAHLSPTYGLTYKEIEREGFLIDAKIDMLLASDTDVGLAKSIGLCTIGMSESLARLRPHILVVLGDRYELLAICSAATVMNIPVAHISGGDLTEGAIDNQVRHAVTKLAHVHFPGTQASAERLVQMGEDPSRVFAVGEPGLDNFFRTAAMTKTDVASSLGLDVAKRWVIFTMHPETAGTIAADVDRTRTALDVLAEQPDMQVVMTYPNADLGNLKIAALLEERHTRAPHRFKLFKSLGQDRFVGLLRHAYAMVGNSSGGIVEAPSVKLPVVNIGSRQLGRVAAPNVITVSGDRASIESALTQFEMPSFRAAIAAFENPYGDGKSAARIKDVLKSIPLRDLLRKPFHAIDWR